MIAQEFLAELAKAKDVFDWKVSAESRLDDDRRTRPRRKIRAYSKSNPDLFFGPIGAVCYQLTGKIFDEDSWMQAAEAIQLSLIDAGDVIAATNDRVWKGAGRDRKPDPYLQRLRIRLVEAIGLDLAE